MTGSSVAIKIVLIGSGNVASHLGKAIASIKGYPIAQVYSKTPANAKRLATKLNCPCTSLPHEILLNADLYLICVKDDEIKNVLNTISKVLPQSSFVAHTSGSVSGTIIDSYFQEYGVFYPLQTFSLNKKVNLSQVPILISGTSKAIKILQSVGQRISDKIYVVGDAEREYIHLAAVLVNNFTNGLFDIADQLLEKQKLSFDILLPLIKETIHKLDDLSPVDAQTGPARRGDIRILAKHKKLLKTEYPQWLQLYTIFSNILMETHKSS